MRTPEGGREGGRRREGGREGEGEELTPQNTVFV